ncbi:MAG: hypothetical protein D6707_04755, partial [Bacteroidetes bacterium]
GILNIEYKSHIDFKAEDFPAHKEAILKLCDNIPRPFLIDLRHTYFSAISNDALKLLAKDKEIQEARLCNAFVIEKIADRLVVNFYLRIFQPENPAKTFKTPEAAIEWCKKFITQKARG